MRGERNDDPRLSLGGALLRGRTRSAVGLGGALVWLAFILFPLANAIGRRGPDLQHWLAVAGAALFVVAYVLLVFSWRRDSRSSTRVVLFGVLIACALALTVLDRSGWGFLFTYCAACAGLIAPPPLGSIGVILCAALAGATAALNGASGGAVVGFVASAAGIGLLMLLLRDLRIHNEELTEARAELARLAVAQERERFARDLHDLLGHTLSVIALKAELAGRLLPGRSSDAKREIAEVEQVARTALSEVREAVSGYRQPTLDGELAGAKMALSAAGIEADIRRGHIPLDPAVEAVLAWAVREGATNVIRHSGAGRCTLRIGATLTDATAEIIDDGGGAAGLAGAGVAGAGVAGAGVAGAGVAGAGVAGAGGKSGASRPSAAGGGLSADGRALNPADRPVAGGAPRPGARIGAAARAGSGHRGSAAGHGLDGLAERAAALGGTVEAGPLPGGGFRLAVRVPVDPEPAGGTSGLEAHDVRVQPPATAAVAGSPGGADS
ncbi:MAG TPA: histidine kinase [Solirubrobacteraceae bacterium]|nr:histidine kinase [Solirubrobacteraceae bacterium]